MFMTWQSPIALVDQVLSPDLTISLEAQNKLEQMGLPVLAALRVTLGRTTDTNQTQKLQQLIDVIERQRLLRGTKIHYAERDISIADSISELSRESHIRLVLDSRNDQEWSNRKISLDTKESWQFWRVLDQLGQQGMFTYESSPGGSNSSMESKLRIIRANESRPPTSYAGPFRASLLSLEWFREVTQVKPGAKPKQLDEFIATVELIAEPGLLIERNGLPRIVEAIDSTEKDMRFGSKKLMSTNGVSNYSTRNWYSNALSSLTYQISLGAPKSHEAKLKHLRGTLPISILARTDSLVTIPVDTSEGRVIQGPGFTAKLENYQRTASNLSSFDVILQGVPINNTPQIASGPRQLTIGKLTPPFLAENHIQVFDRLGNPYSTTSNIKVILRNNTANIHIQLHPVGLQNGPLTLKYYGILAEVTEVPFDFKDIPLP
jgi:hypothetical protein